MGKNKYRNNNDSFDVTKLKVKIIVIGYGLYGESTLVFLMDEDVVFYTIIIDSYHYKKDNIKGSPYINKTIDLLIKYGVKRLDVLCWTHPHDDHSKGIPRLIKHFCDSDTKILYPMYLEDNEKDIVKYGDTSKQNLKSILRVNREHKGLATPIGVPDKGEENIDEFNVLDIYNSEPVACVRIDALTPISSMLTEYVNEGLCNDSNELSITLVIDINGYSFYFGGDTTNKHINHSKQLKMGRCKFVKIPHHASKTAKDLVNYLPPMLDGVCTTVYKRGKADLPDNGVLRLYRPYGANIYSTNKLKRDDVAYGIIEYDCDFSTGVPWVEAKSDGISGVI